MEPTSERRFDANFVAQILLEIAHEQSLEKLLQKLVERAMERPHIVCAQVWLIEKGDLCATCPTSPRMSRPVPLPALGCGESEIHFGAGKGFGRLDS